MKHLVYDSYADMYMYAKLYHNRRPGIWSSSSDYVRLHLALQAAISSPDMYTAVNGSTTNTNAVTSVNTNTVVPAAPTVHLNAVSVNLNANGTISNDHIRMPPEGMESSENNYTLA